MEPMSRGFVAALVDRVLGPRWWLLAVCALAMSSTGCLLGYVGAAGAVAMGPTVLPLAGAQTGKGDGTFEMGLTMLGDGRGPMDTTVEKGGGFRMASVGKMGAGRIVALAHGRTEVGLFGEDRRYGWTGADVGPGVRLGRTTLGVGLGYSFGGYPQSKHNVPAVLALYYRGESVAFRTAAYAGWRFGDADTFPEAEAFGPGWKTAGFDAAVILGGAGKGVSVGITIDRQDDITVSALTIGATLTPERKQR